MHLKTEAEIGAMCLQAKDLQGLPGITTGWERGTGEIFSHSPQEESALLVISSLRSGAVRKSLLLFEATQFEVLCYRSSRTPTGLGRMIKVSIYSALPVGQVLYTYCGETARDPSKHIITNDL